MDGAAYVITFQPGHLYELIYHTLSGEGCIAMYGNGHHTVAPAFIEDVSFGTHIADYDRRNRFKM